MSRLAVMLGLTLSLWVGLSSSALAAQKQKWWLNDMSLGGVVGSWGGVPLAGLRGSFPVGKHLSLRVGWALSFDMQNEQPISYSKLALDLLIRLPSPLNSIRYYALTRLDFWPLWDFFGVNSKVRDISSQPTFGFSMLLGIESFLIPGFAMVLETGFSSGMLIGFSPIDSKYQSFGFVIQSGVQLYF